MANTETIELVAKDGVAFLGDLYLADNDDNNFILLFHQAGYSRGEYLEIAPRLNELGFNCLAIDQRSGQEVNGIKNSATIDALSKEKPVAFHDALPDLEAAVDYVFTHYRPNKLIIMGSSYSSSMVFVLGSIYDNLIDGIISFSPGEYFAIEKKQIAHYAKQIQSPVFVTSSQSEANKWEQIFENIPSENKISFIPKGKGLHGAKALWPKQADQKEYWDALEAFLETV